MIRPLIATGTSVVLGLACWSAFPATAAPTAHGGVCKLTGSATISPGLTTTAKNQAITLSGVSLSSCKAGTTAKPGLPPTISASVSTSPNPTYATASCASGNLSLSATIHWSNGTTTTASISTKGVTANQAITGSVTSSSNPDLAAGDKVAGDVAFKPTTTSQNCVKTPVTAVTFVGVLGAGS